MVGTGLYIITLCQNQNQEYNLSHQRKRKLPSHTRKEKAKKILRHGQVRGKPLTKKQKGLFGVIASGKKPRK